MKSLKANTAKWIKNWPEIERPRERLIRHGPEMLSDAQLLAILLRTGRQKSSALEMAHHLLKQFGGLAALKQATVSELCSVSGVGPAKASQILASFELGRRSMAQPLNTGLRALSSRDIYHHYHPLLREMKKEVFNLLMFDGKNRLLKEMTISTGSLSLNIVHPREVFKPAVKESASAVILLHNHPSGDPAPSPEDRELTRRLVKAGRVMGIKVLDHIVIGDGNYFSFADQGWEIGD
ncbi:MAG: DNA repair protein RadC [Nitrospirae bacterium]|nr:DNA repair protein RadC [Nitrospirota bacterium]